MSTTNEISLSLLTPKHPKLFPQVDPKSWKKGGIWTFQVFLNMLYPGLARFSMWPSSWKDWRLVLLPLVKTIKNTVTKTLLLSSLIYLWKLQYYNLSGREGKIEMLIMLIPTFAYFLFLTSSLCLKSIWIKCSYTNPYYQKDFIGNTTSSILFFVKFSYQRLDSFIWVI